ncbi:MAG: hypothetical protein AUJ20_13725 [Comamonadaceae bacterium CG1_02_60_18]|nr:MAG: hypothetical protein AUJ20_13725 [Comamonadaceae bacterium CG1_02_60_18]PIQ55872.1 MAG: hypothetical protein COW02_02130 [Comamonadaceae bacterium CG12_big_fil_rev_8_21_14_0_65_59_15]
MSRSTLIPNLGLRLVLLTLLLVALNCNAQTERDPTRSPVVQNESGAVVPPKGLIDAGQMALMVRAGVPYLVHDARLYAVGQKIGAARIERLTETEVWLREVGVLRKVRVFPGVERHLGAPEPVPSVAASKQRKLRASRPLSSD